MRLIVGLGNPGPEHEADRHNTGFRVIDELRGSVRSVTECHSHQALAYQGKLRGQLVTLLKPLTYMNLSGQAVHGWLGKLRLSIADLLIITDDVNLPLGSFRLRPQGGAGGHNGLASLIDSLGIEKFARVRIGIDCPDRNGLTNHVLGPFSAAEEEILQPVVKEVAKLVNSWVRDGNELTMNRYNRRMADEKK